jgi:ATP-dependent 26S proteasome regulatory subunit
MRARPVGHGRPLRPDDHRAELLEPALAQRPGRVDEAVELPLPDADGRVRLLHLYGAELGWSCKPDNPVVERTVGVSAAFIRELLRRAALLATLSGAEAVADEHVTKALDELEEAHSQPTRRLLGATG